VPPLPADPFNLNLTAELTHGSDLAGDTRDFGCEGAELRHHVVDCVFQLSNLSFCLDLNLLRQVAVRHSGGDSRDCPNLVRKGVTHAVHLCEG